MRHASVKDYEKALSGGEPSWKEGEVTIPTQKRVKNSHSHILKRPKHQKQILKSWKSWMMTISKILVLFAA
jgi:hypothetical protein